jgi:hypothetical protein
MLKSCTLFREGCCAKSSDLVGLLRASEDVREVMTFRQMERVDVVLIQTKLSFGHRSRALWSALNTDLSARVLLQ